eukprot:7860409-Pyramimonas_sp.AAC.1
MASSRPPPRRPRGTSDQVNPTPGQSGPSKDPAGSCAQARVHEPLAVQAAARFRALTDPRSR